MPLNRVSSSSFVFREGPHQLAIRVRTFCMVTIQMRPGNESNPGLRKTQSRADQQRRRGRKRTNGGQRSRLTTKVIASLRWGSICPSIWTAIRLGAFRGPETRVYHRAVSPRTARGSQVLGVGVPLLRIATGHRMMHRCMHRRMLRCWTRDLRGVVDWAVVGMASTHYQAGTMVDCIRRPLSMSHSLRAVHLVQRARVRCIDQPNTRNWSLGKYCPRWNQSSLRARAETRRTMCEQWSEVCTSY